MTDSNSNEATPPQLLPCEPALQPARYCSHCGKEPETLRTCSQCHVAMYCSQPCQRSDWPLHKQFCSKWATEKGRVTIQGPPLSIDDQWINIHAYWHVFAARDHAAQQVASALRINQVLWSGCPGASCRAIDSTLSRLICTGKDTDENLALFFGEDQVTRVKNSTAYLDIRYKAFLGAPPGSYAFHAVQAWDREMSQRSWTPRDAPEFMSKYCSQMTITLELLEFFDGGATLKQKDLPVLLGVLGDCSWPFTGDSYDTLDALRAALQDLPQFKLDLDLESAGLGHWLIPDDVLVLMRNEGIGLREAAARVLGAGCASNCIRCGHLIPVPLIARNE